MNIWFVSIFEVTPLDDNLNTRFNCLVREAIKKDHEVTFWASTFKHNVKEQRFNTDTEFNLKDDLKLFFIKSKPYYKNISLSRLYSHYIYSKDLIKKFNKQVKKPDLIVIAFPPISIAYEVIIWASAKNIPVVVDIIDPWPDVFEAHFAKVPKVISNLIFSPLRNRVKYIFKNANAVTSISNQYIEWSKRYNSQLKNQACFYPSIDYRLIKEQLVNVSKDIEKRQDVFTVIYAGSLGYSYDIPTILKVAELLYNKYGLQIRFTIAGDGPQKSMVEEYQSKFPNIRYTGRLTKEKLMEEYHCSDMGLTQHIKGATQSVTYKLFDLLACGLPILNSLEGEMRNIILDNNVGLHNTPGDAVGLAENIESCFRNPDKISTMKINAHELTSKEGDSNIVYKRAIEYFETIVLSPLALKE